VHGRKNRRDNIQGARGSVNFNFGAAGDSKAAEFRAEALMAAAQRITIPAQVHLRDSNQVLKKLLAAFTIILPHLLSP
jgi:hypothetical protein